ncbi:MAG: serine hydrolase [Candidatus Hodarchaeota archaeon]
MCFNQFDILERHLIDIMKDMKIPGLTLGVVREGEPVYIKGFGARNLTCNLPMTPDTLFGIGSITKSFTSVAIHQLVEQGKLNLEDPVKNYIDFKLGSEENPITIHHLLSHTTGIPTLDGAGVLVNRYLGKALDTRPLNLLPMSSWQDFMLFINGADTEIISEPGKVFFYNNDFYTCLGLVIEKITEMPFDKYIKDKILTPLEMNRTTFLKEDFEKDENRATGYHPSKMQNRVFEEVFPLFSKFIYPAGGLLSTVREMLNYMQVFMTQGTFKGKQLITPSSINRMMTPVINMYAHGFAIERDFFNHTLIQHDGATSGTSAYLAFIPDLKTGIVLGTNGGDAPLSDIGRGILSVLLGEDLKKVVLLPFLATQQKINQITGKYETYKGVYSGEVKFENGFFYLEGPGSSGVLKLPLVVKDLERLEFHIPKVFPGSIDVKFHIDEESGQVHFISDRYYFHRI